MQQKAALDDLLQYVRILILDDDDNLANAARTSLNLIGYPYVDYTDDPKEAWEKLPYTNILLIDHLLGYAAQTGLEFTRAAKKEFQNNLDVIIYSGNIDELTHFAMEAGATACLEKPLKFEYLELWIKETAKRIWYEKILNAVPDEVIVIDSKSDDFGRIHYANQVKKAKYEQDGKALEYDLCWKRFELQGRGDRPCIGCIPLEALHDKKPVRNYWSYKTWKETRESVDIHAAPIFDQIGQIRCVVETCRDRTQQDIINRNLRRIENATDWKDRLDIFLQGFSELGYGRIRFYQRDSKDGKDIFRGIYQIGMNNNFKIADYSYEAESDIPTQIISLSKYPTLFIVKKEPGYEWRPSTSNVNMYRVSHNFVPHNHILEKQRWIDIPLLADREIIAKVSVEPNEFNRFISSHDLELLSYYAEWAGQALWNAEQRDKLSLKDEMSQLIIEMNQKIAKIPIKDKWVYQTVKMASMVLDTSGCSLFLLEGTGENQKLVRKATFVRDLNGDRVRKIDMKESYAVGESIIGGAYKTGRSRLLNNMVYISKNQQKPNVLKINQEAYRYYCDVVGEDIRNVMCAVIGSGKNKVGVIRAINKQRSDVFGNRDFNQDDLRALQALAGQISIGIETDQLIRKLRASYDFNEFIAQEYLHTMKNIMQPVMSMTELLKDDPSDIELWEILENEIKKLRTTINTMTQLVTIEHTKMQVRKAMVNVKAIVDDVLKPYIILAADYDMTITTNVNSKIKEAFIDRQLIYDAVANLLDNAIKYGDDNTEIVIQVEKINESLEISVSDIGQVIPVENQTKVFERFFLGNHQVDKIRQLGLGLTFVKAVAEAHGGTAFVDPHFQNGARIVMSLPCFEIKEEEES